jgi:isoaspartyl peptidase/L-asparaginase-like protein (Ntn-hydrolase superfamily)
VSENIKKITEEEEAEWRLLEIRQSAKQAKMEDSAYDAVLAAQQFVEDTPSHELSIMTLRKAFELGFRKGRK